VAQFNPFKENIRSLSAKGHRRAQWSSGIRLDRAEAPFPPSPEILGALQIWAAEGNRYPEPDCGTLRQAIARYAVCSPTQVLVGSGSDELIDTIVRCCVNPGEEIVVPAPTFYFYQRSAQIHGGRVVIAKTTDSLDVMAEQVLASISSATKVVFIANPNNPTGKLAAKDQIESVIANCPCLVVIDECYFEFSGATVIDLIDRYQNLIVLRSFSKAFGLAGMRLGYAIGNEMIIERLYTAMQPFPVSGAAQAVGLAALGDLNYMRSNIQGVKRELARLTSGLEEIGFQVYPSHTNFVLANTFNTDVSASVIVDALNKSEIYIWDCTGTPGAGNNHVRITTGTPEQNDLLVASLKNILERVSA